MFRALFKRKRPTPALPRPDEADAHYKRGNALKDLGQFAAALAAYDKAVEHRPDFAYAWCNRGVVQQRLSLYKPALVSYARAITFDPADALVHVNHGALLQEISSWDLALASYDRALGLDPRMFDVWFHRGNVLRELQRWDEALGSYNEALKLKADYTEAHYNCGVLLERTGKARAALASYERAIAIYPAFHQAHYNRAGVLKTLGEREAAVIAYDGAIAAYGDYADAHANRGVVLQELGHREAALQSYDRAIAIRTDYAEAYFNRGTLFSEQMQWDAALASYDDAIARRPAYAPAYCERARVLLQVKRLDEAVFSYTQAIAIDPEFAEAHYNRSLALLLGGDYENGWLNYEWRWKNTDRLSLAESRTFGQPLWLGKESIAGKRLLVYCEQGYGDTLQFCRFAKAVRDLGGTVILEVQEALASLMASVDGVSRVITQGSPLPEFDYQCPLMSLPLALKTRISTIPAPPRYLRSDDTKVAGWRGRLTQSGLPRIGLAWSGNPKQGNDHNRSIRLADWISHLPPAFQYVCLQTELRSTDVDVLEANPWIARFDAELHDFSDTAALCECVDLVISVCTSVAHLSGALGRPTWVVLPFVPDWRWLLDRDDSPWYPTAKLYRQQQIGDWTGVLARISADLQSGAARGDFGR